jgi:hypothetical protein
MIFISSAGFPAKKRIIRQAMSLSGFYFPYLPVYVFDRRNKGAMCAPFCGELDFTAKKSPGACRVFR